MATEPIPRWRVSYGIPPRLNPEFQRTGKGSMFLEPHRTQPEGVAHFPVHRGENGGVEFPTLDDFLVHARKFGTQCVLETAEEYLAAADCAQLKAAIRRIAGEHRRAKKPSNWYDDVQDFTDEEVAGLAEDMTTAEVAVLIGKSKAAVHSALQRWSGTSSECDGGMEVSHVN
jgi:hypothetical protein